MKKTFAGIVIAALFFFIGRNQPAIVVKNSHNDSEAVSSPSKVHQQALSDTDQPTPIFQTQSEEVPAQQLTFNERLITSLDTELFETVYSNEFKTNWQSALPVLKQRLFKSLPKISGDPEFFEKEVAARIGILKALNISETENSEELKEFLFSYLEFSAKSQNADQAWLLQREAAHTLTQNNDLDETEQSRVANNLDPRARNTATRRDADLIDRTLAGDE